MDYYSKNYLKQIADLKEWFLSRLKDNIYLTREQYNDGIDSLHFGYRNLCSDASSSWLKEKEYGLSYNQMCKAFFAAAIERKILKIIKPVQKMAKWQK